MGSRVHNYEPNITAVCCQIPASNPNCPVARSGRGEGPMECFPSPECSTLDVRNAPLRQSESLARAFCANTELYLLGSKRLQDILLGALAR